jgi:DNA-binding HxlR family transcriptional regulator
VQRSEIVEIPGPGATREPRLKPRWQRRSAVKESEPGTRDFSDELMRIVGDRWSTALLAAVTRGDGTFGDLQQRLHISSHLLSERLKELVAYGLMERVAYGTRPERLRYSLTAKGEALLLSHWLLMKWGDRWLAGPEGPPLLVEHGRCGEPFVAELHCSECGGKLRPGNFSFEPDVTLRVFQPDAGALPPDAP